MTELDIRKQVLAELGAPTIKVEVDDAIWDKIFLMAKRWFRAKKGLVKMWVLPIASGQSCYDYPDNADAIVDVILPMRSDVASLLSLGFFDVIPINGIGMGSQGNLSNFYSGYVQMLQSLETRRRVFSADPSWYTIDRKIFLSPNGAGGACYSISVPQSCCGDSVSGGGDVSGFAYDCNVNIGLGALVLYKPESFSIEDLRGRDEDLIYRFVLAQVKKILGRIRSKYSSYPSAGGTIDTDGTLLLDEARAELEILEEEISESQGAMGFIVG